MIPQNSIRLDGPEYVQSVTECLTRGWITEGRVAEGFKHSLRLRTRLPHVALAPNGTLALYLALRAAGVGPGDEVIVPDLTFVGSATAVLLTGATPFFVDVDERGLLRPDWDRAIGPRTKAVMPVHLFGFCAPSHAFGLPVVVEDACQALGVIPHTDGDVLSVARIQALSFFADKAFTTGEGGAIATSDPVIYERACYIRNQGRRERGSFRHPEIGINLRMTDLQCCIGSLQLDDFDKVRDERYRVWTCYDDLLEGDEDISLVQPPAPEQQGPCFIPFRAVVCLLRGVAQEVATVMRARGVVEPREMFMPLHLQPCFAGLPGAHGAPGHAERYRGAIAMWQHCLLLPCWPAMTAAEVKTVVDEVCFVYREITR